MSAETSPAAVAQQFRLDHFVCYGVEPSERFQPRAVTVVDQFGRRRTTLVRLELLCNPVKKNKGVVRNPRAHLVCYFERTRPLTARRASMTNQFGRATVTVAQPHVLCLPSGKARGDERPRPPEGLGHYACYLGRASPQPRPRSVDLADQFGRFRARTGRVVSICNPASKNGSRILNRRDHLTCFELEPARQPAPVRVAYTNQFGRGGLVAARPARLCLPSLKRVVVRPNLTVQIPNAQFPITCPAGQGSCLLTVNFTVSNPSATAVGVPFQVLIEADPGQTKTIVVPGLAAGGSQSFSEVVGPGNNCYDPDCTVRVTVDSGGAVAESNEGDNVATHTALG